MRWWNWVAGSNREGKEEHMRIFVNDARQPLGFCGAGEDVDLRRRGGDDDTKNKS